jgi:hypothetical protein
MHTCFGCLEGLARESLGAKVSRAAGSCGGKSPPAEAEH